jgi:hypothetical protein
MVSATQKIWEAVANLDRTDTHTVALCHAIIDMMVHQGVVSRQEANQQIEKSILKVVSIHKRIVNAMHGLNTAPVAHAEPETIQ